MEQLNEFIACYNWLIRQNGQGVNTPQPRALANIIKAMFRKAGMEAVRDANRVWQNEKTTRPAIIERTRQQTKPGNLPSERRAQRIAQREAPVTDQQAKETQALTRRLSRVISRTGGLPQGLEQQENVVEDKPARKQRANDESAIKAVTIGTEDAQHIAKMSPRQIAGAYTREAMEASLIAMGETPEALSNRSDKQLAAILKTKITED